MDMTLPVSAAMEKGNGA